MTGDKPVPDASGEHEPLVPVSFSEEQAPMAGPLLSAEEPVSTEPPPVENVVSQPPPFATKAPRTQAPERSRLLDLSVPPARAASRRRASSSRGLSVLGLDDPPPVSSYEAEHTVGRRRHGRSWVAAIVVVILAGLGFLAWQAEKSQSNQGPNRHLEDADRAPESAQC